METVGFTGGPMDRFDALSDEEIRSFAARLEVDPYNLRHIIEPMEGIACVNLREELERCGSPTTTWRRSAPKG